MKTLLVLLLVALGTSGGQNPPVVPFEKHAELTSDTPIDELVFGRLKQLKIQPAGLCSDAVFVRRVYLDAIGTLPTAEEARRFLADRDPHKRSKLVDQLLARDEFADYWAMRWSDSLRVKAEFPINLWPNAVQAYYRWIHTSVKKNVPYDRFVREMLTASGSNFRVPAVNFYRAVQNREPKTIAAAVALAFMGARTEKWSEERRAEMSVFFSQVGYKSTDEWKEEIIFFDALAKPAKNGAETVLPDGTRRRLLPGEDPRAVFADWLTRSENPWFARNITNRVWYWLLGRGIVHEPDDLRPDNRPSNPELLAYLEEELVASKYDLKHIYRLILNSKTYQLSCIPRTNHPDAEANFAYYPLRRLDAEVLIDALCQITDTTEEYSSLIPEPFTFIPREQHSVALADGSITSSFLETFGRPPRDTGLMSERDNRPSAAGQLHLLNSSHIRHKIEQSEKLRQVMRSGRNPAEKVRNLYLTILSRPPTKEELLVVRDYANSGQIKRWEVMVDLAWALVNSAEFLYRH
ncbi:MAG: DUF1553 domain-containing protein [Pirellulales bacterium]|nr:DUF1553 domain-containing protein [Pirellulales bacterium]